MKKIKSSSKGKLTIFALAFAMLAQIFLPIQNASADAPSFNQMSGDEELLKGSTNVASTNPLEASDPIAGLAGDTFKGFIYYHNGTVNDTVAYSTRIKLSIPTVSTNSTILMNASIGADNVSGLTTDTIVNGVIVGKSGLTTSLDADAIVQLVPGSVKWYPEASPLSGTPQVLPSGQTGDEITGAGINIGDIQSCWNHAGHITFLYKTTKLQSDIKIEKTVQNITLGQSTWEKSTTGKPNQTIGFKVSVKNNGNTAIDDLNILDQLPGDLEYVNGTLLSSIDGGLSFSAISDNALVGKFFNNGINHDVLTKNQEIIYKFNTKVTNFVNSDHTVINTARASSGTINVIDQASVDIKADLVPPTIVRNKIAKNLTQNTEGKNLSANVNDEILYTLTTKNTGGTATDVVVEDGVADILDYAKVVAISDAGQLVDGTVGNDEKIVRYSSVNLAPGESIVRTFKIKVDSVLQNTPQLGFRFDYIMYNKYGDDVVNITLQKPVPGSPVLGIEKTVRNVTQNETAFAKSNFATPGDTLEYKISFTNTGSGPAPYIKISDVLPANVQFLSGTTLYSFNGDTEKTLSDGISNGQGVSFNSLQAGESGYVKFKAVTSSDLANNENLVNTTYIKSMELTSSSTATTVIRKTTTPVTVAKTTPTSLPKTGAATVVLSLLLALSGVTMLTYYRLKNRLSQLQSL